MRKKSIKIELNLSSLTAIDILKESIGSDKWLSINSPDKMIIGIIKKNKFII